MAILETKNEKYVYTPSGRGTVTLPTAGTFIDRDIVISDQAAQVVVDNGATTLTAGNGSASLTASTGMTLETNAPATGTYYTLTATGSGKVSGSSSGTVSFTDGFVSEDTKTVSSSAAEISSKTATVNKYIPQSTLSADTVTPGAEQTVTIGAGYYPSQRTITIGAASTGGTAELSASATGSATIDSVTIGNLNSSTNTYPVTGSANITGTATANTTKSGFASANATKATGSTTGTASLSASIAAAAIGVKSTDPGTGYAENTTAVVPAGGYLTIEAGYVPKTKISLSTLVPDDANIVAGDNANLRTGQTAYTKDGALVTGTMNDTSRTAGSTTITSDYLTTTNTGYPVKASGSVSTGTGYITSGSTSSAEATKYVIAAATPSLAITDKTSTNLTVGTKSSNYYPMTTSLEGKMTVGTAGWVPTTGLTATDSSVTVGRLPAAVVSVSGSTAATAPTIGTGTAAGTAKGTAISATPTTTVPTNTNNYYVAIKANAPATTVSLTKTITTKGYLGADAEITASASTTAKDGSVYYVPITGAGVQTKALQATTDTTTYPSGYSAYRVTAPIGYRASAAYTDIPVYQGNYSIS